MQAEMRFSARMFESSMTGLQRRVDNIESNDDQVRTSSRMSTAYMPGNFSDSERI